VLQSLMEFTSPVRRLLRHNCGQLVERLGMRI
jgi:hypothetical protein